MLLLVHTLVGTALVAAGTNAWNQIRERDVDARMARTRRRPLPSGRLTPRVAMWFASVITVGGVAYLAATVNLLTAGLAALTFASYVLLYTPMKRTTSLNTLVGTTLLVGSANTLNMYLERDVDARMARTRNRPLPAGRVAPLEAQVLGVALSLAGIALLAVLLVIIVLMERP